MRSNYAQVVNESSDDFLSSALNIPIFLIAFHLISHRSPPFASSIRPRASTLNPLLILIGFAIAQQISLTHSLARCELRCVLYMAAATEYGREGGQPGTATDGQKQKSGEPPPPPAAAAAKVCVQSVGHDGDSLAPVRILHSLPPPNVQMIRCGAKTVHIEKTLELIC